MGPIVFCIKNDGVYFNGVANKRNRYSVFIRTISILVICVIPTDGNRHITSVQGVRNLSTADSCREARNGSFRNRIRNFNRSSSAGAKLRKINGCEGPFAGCIRTNGNRINGGVALFDINRNIFRKQINAVVFQLPENFAAYGSRNQRERECGCSAFSCGIGQFITGYAELGPGVVNNLTILTLQKIA